MWVLSIPIHENGKQVPCKGVNQLPDITRHPGCSAYENGFNVLFSNSFGLMDMYAMFVHVIDVCQYKTVQIHHKTCCSLLHFSMRITHLWPHPTQSQYSDSRLTSPCINSNIRWLTAACCEMLCDAILNCKHPRYWPVQMSEL